ncbi:MAG: 2-oxoglutarate dehydrogenase complex dihydrolipoyllysine-residue succinyltransferase [Chloroflexi bacterium]|nr:2-oxoglutarate dehydrogenase complex dihydrolipoyllysine-residue succinyltransferase [Chloroflexota bacterium]
MPVEVRVPVLGESVTEATVATWLKHEGDVVEAGEPLVELETDKVNVDVAAERSGKLVQITHGPGETVHPGDVLAMVDETIGQSGDGLAPAGQVHAQATGSAPENPVASGSPGPASTLPAPPSAPPTTTPSSELVDRPHASPVARRMADEHGLDLSRIAGSGTAGRVTREDVEQYLGRQAVAVQAQQPTPAAPSPPVTRPADARGEERVRMSRRRQTIAMRLLEAQRTAAMLTTFNEVDMTNVMALRRERREEFQKRHGIGLGYMSFFTKASVAALRAFPRMNAEIQGDEIVLKKYYDIGIAVGAAEGLVVPVVRDADRKSFAQIEREITQLAEKARTNTLTLDDLRGGTFTITNGGVFGSLLSTPILSPPQVGILGMHKIEQRPVVVDGAIVARPMMYLALSYDHRLVDGQEAVQFLVRIKELIDDPTALLLDS